MNREDPAGESAFEQKVREHTGACDECAAAPPAAEDIAAVLGSYAVALDAAPLSQKVLLCLRPELSALAAASYRRRVGLGLMAALLLLPVLLLVDAYLLHLAYTFVSAILPRTLAAYLVLSYGALLFLVIATTYAAIPLLLARASALRPLPAT